MSIFIDKWVKKAMVDDTIVAEELLHLHHRHHQQQQQPSLHDGLLTPWLVRQRRTPRMLIPAARPYRTNPNSPLSWTSPLKPSGSKAVDQSETTNAESSTKKRGADQSETAYAQRSMEKMAVDERSSHKTLNEIKREVKLKLTKRENLRDELAAMKLAFEKEKASNDMLKRRKLGMVSQRPMETVQPFLDRPDEFVVADHDQRNLVSPAQVVQEKTLQDETLVCACAASASARARASSSASARASASATASATASPPSNQEDINGLKPFLLPDLNVPPNEHFTNFFVYYY